MACSRQLSGVRWNIDGQLGVNKLCNGSQRMNCAMRGALVGALLVCGLLALFYITTHRGIVLWMIWKLTPLSGLLPAFPLQRGIAPTTLTLRLYDVRLVLCGALEGFLVGIPI